jgi:hypothetical protein
MRLVVMLTYVHTMRKFAFSIRRPLALHALLHSSLQGVVFGLVGFCAGVIGTSLSNGLIAMRKRLDPNFEVPHLPADFSNIRPEMAASAAVHPCACMQDHASGCVSCNRFRTSRRVSYPMRVCGRRIWACHPMYGTRHSMA